MDQDKPGGDESWITYVSVFSALGLIILAGCWFMIRRAFCNNCHLETANESDPPLEDGFRKWDPPPPYHLALKCKKPRRLPTYVGLYRTLGDDNLRPCETHHTLAYAISETITLKTSPNPCSHVGIVSEAGRSQHSFCFTEKVEDYLPSYDEAIHSLIMAAD